MKKQLLLTRKQFEEIKKVFEEYDIDYILLTKDNSSGIGENVYMEFDPLRTITKDITDYEAW